VLETELLRKGSKATPHIGVKGLRSIPIPNIKINQQNEIKNLVSKIIEAKNNNATTTKYEFSINEMVYKLYNLTTDEITIIENEPA